MADLLQTYLFRVILIPASVFLAVFYGGGYATGLEIVSYLSSSGPVAGFVAISVTAFLFGTAIFLVYELGRQFSAYDYSAFSKVILGKKAAPVYEIIFTILMFLSLAYTATAGGTAISIHFGFPRSIVTAVFLVAVVFLTYQGRRIVEMTMVATAITLVLCVVSMATFAVVFFEGAIVQEMQDSTIDLVPMLKQVSIYAVAIMVYIPIVMYNCRNLRSRRETLIAGYATGFVYVIPAFCMHIAFLSHYSEAMEQEVPNLWIAGKIMPPLFVDVFAVVLLIAIMQTAVGVMQGFLERLDSWSLLKRNEPLSKKAHGGISATAMVACLLLSGMGVVSLLAKIFAFSFSLSLVVFVVPICTVGIYKIATSTAAQNVE
jgi:uncharacterized membrane protein YkvI